MKKVLFGILVAGVASLSANNANLEIKPLSNDEHEISTGVFIGLEKQLPTTHKVLTDYFKAKTCSEDVTKYVSSKDISEFGATLTFGTLLGLTENEDAGSKHLYDSLILGFKHMNCGGGDGSNLDEYLTKISNIHKH